jgi:hypothetical protein
MSALSRSFGSILAACSAALLTAYVTVVGPMQSGVFELRKELESVSARLDPYHRRGTTLLNERWLEAANSRIHEVEAHFEKARTFFAERQEGEDGFKRSATARFKSPVEFKVACEFEQAKLRELARQSLQTVLPGCFQLCQFEPQPAPADYPRLFAELWLQRELVRILGQATVRELVRIHLPESPSAPSQGPGEPAERPREWGGLGEMRFEVECRVSPDAIARLFNALMASTANIVPEKLAVAAVRSGDGGKGVILDLKLTACALPGLP